MLSNLRLKTLILSIFLLLGGHPSLVLAQNISAYDIVKAADDLLQGKSYAGKYSMKIVTPKWERQLDLQVFSENREKTFIRILSPAKEAGIGTLRIKNEMWNYLPRVEKIIKIPPSMMLQPWMGSDFANDDLVNESSIVNDYTHKITGKVILDTHKTYQVELTPKPDAPVIWGKIIMWVRKDDYVPIKEEYYSERGKLIKTLNYSNIEPVSNRILPKTWTMKSNTKKNHYTVIQLIDVVYDEPIDANIFTRANLKRIQ